MSQTNLSISQTQRGEYWGIPSMVQGTFQFAKNLVTWEGRDVSQLDDATFLRQDAWQNNLRLLSTNHPVMPISSLTTKEMYCWLTKDSYIIEGYQSVKTQKEAKSAEAFICWLRTGVIAGIACAFFKQFLFNFNCLETLGELECRVLAGEMISQPATIAKIGFFAGVWFTTGCFLHSLGKYGLYGYLKGIKLNDDLFYVYKVTADSVRSAFWNAVDNNDEATARSIYEQVKMIKNNFKDYKEEMISYLEIDPAKFEAKIRPFYLLIEDLQTQKMEELFPKKKVENIVVDAVPPNDSIIITEAEK